jgi:hypothetical protein
MTTARFIVRTADGRLGCRSVGLAWLLLALAWSPAIAGPEHSGRQHQLDVQIPRLEAAVTIDGALDEPTWSQAAVLTDFSQYAPDDGRPAENETRVLVWYSPTAIFFGIKAHAAPGTIRATLADRDRIDGDDHIQVYLSTFNDGRQAFLFAVNPLGVQADGALVEGTQASGHEFRGLVVGRESADLSPDFVFESKGRLTEYGYEVEIRIPFKTLRYQSSDQQDWGVHVVRRVQSTGHDESWAPARRAASSFLGQAGRLRGLRDLHRGLVLDLNPVTTAKADGAEASGGGWRYDFPTPEFGGNIRWGATPTLTLNATINPDFSQVESDAGQFVYDPRQALYFPEKRPFFLDGIEQFSTPNNLIYTRRIVAPLAAAKLTGRISSTAVAFLTAVDDQVASAAGETHPVFNILRVQRDVGGESKAAFVYTDRVDGDSSNRVAAADARVTFRKIYTVQAQGAVSRTHRLGVTTTAPLWQTTVSRSGRRYGFRYLFRAISDDFRAEAGFISRAGVATANVVNQITLYGGKGSALERWTGDVTVDGTWQYDRFVHGRPSQDRKLHFNSNFTLRGGWGAGQSLLVETFGYDENLYRNYALLRVAPDGQASLLPFTGTPRLPNLDYVLSLDTPRLKGFSASVFALWGRDENFYEWSSANILFLEAEALWRPTERLRVDGTYRVQSYERRTDHTLVGRRRLPRLKVEYQMTRAIFVRVVSQYDAEVQDDLRDDSRSDLPIVIVDPATGEYSRALGFERNTLRTDFLFSYQPTPGTVVFAGYGNTLADPDARDRIGRRRLTDGFFLKISYLFRMK